MSLKIKDQLYYLQNYNFKSYILLYQQSISPNRKYKDRDIVSKNYLSSIRFIDEEGKVYPEIIKKVLHINKHINNIYLNSYK
ncbi:hypothetical protein CHBEV_031 [Choristoneura biennis entomopoxvirus]|uniref:Uncharacterized protein n=1 Tax=Choristoneura biennis entomopoxvirus TaxID=10288 RepID=A0A916KPD3_CBEPV|nr:hypothetical protein CHBEV_031 [Choristoneura biennis entomopoxvirus]CCU55599.1 hypothetical protein CHBEV_031 [Choristoneura biennis entomopoxvirus]